MELEHLFEQLFQEASALEVYDQTFKEKFTPEEFLAVLNIDPTAVVTQAPGDGSAQATLAQSKKGSYTDWIIRQMKALSPTARARFLGEDADQLKELLTIYKALTQNKEGVAKLEAAARNADLTIANVKDLNQIKTADMLSAITSPFKGKDAKALSTQEDRQITVVYNDDTWQVVIPLTHAAARKYGTGTEWCTATSNPRWFKQYTADGPLFIIRAKQVTPPDCRWQYHKESGQFMDYRDNAISVRRFLTTFLPKYGEKTKAMSSAIYGISKSDAWNPQRFEKEHAKKIAAIQKAIAECGGDVDEAVIRSGKRATPVVIAACQEGDTDLLDTLLNQYHADPVVFDASGTSALSTAITSNNIDAFKMLLQAGAPEAMLAQREGSTGATAIHRICDELNTTMLNYALEKLPINLRVQYLNLRDYKRRTPLMYAINTSNAEDEQTILPIVSLIVETIEGAGQTLTESVFRKFYEDEEEATQEKPNLLNLRDLEGHTALSYAYAEGYTMIAKYLGDHGAIIEAVRPLAWKGISTRPTFFSTFIDDPTSIIVQKSLENMTSDNLYEVIRRTAQFTDPGKRYATIEYGTKVAALLDVLLTKFLQVLNTKMRKPDYILPSEFADWKSTEIRNKLSDILEATTGRNNLPVIKLLHEKYGVPLTVDPEDEYNSALRALFSESNAPTEQLRQIYEYFFTNGCTSKDLLLIIGPRGDDDIFEYLEDSDNANLEVIQLILERLPQKMIPRILGTDGLSKLVKQYKKTLYNVTGADELEDLRQPTPQEKEQETAKLMTLIAFLMSVGLPKSKEMINICLDGVELFDFVEHFIDMGFPVMKSDMYYSILYKNFCNRGSEFFDEDDDETMPRIDSLVKEYRAKFDYLRNTLKCNINAPSSERVNNQTVLGRLLCFGSRQNGLRKSAEFAAWVDQLREQGALTTQEYRFSVLAKKVKAAGKPEPTLKYSKEKPSFDMARAYLANASPEILAAERARVARSRNGRAINYWEI